MIDNTNYKYNELPSQQVSMYRASDFHNLNEASFGEFNPTTHACLRVTHRQAHRQKNLCNLRNLRIKNKKGFTLIEIIIVIIVLGILSVFGFHFISTGIHTYSMMEKQKGLFDQATMVMERISRELRDANTITNPTSGTDTTLTFTKSHYTIEEEVDETDVITFELSGSTLERDGSTTDVILADNVTAFTVTNSSNGITISLTLESGETNITLRSYICPKNLDYPCPAPPDPCAPSGRNFGGSWEEDIQQ